MNLINYHKMKFLRLAFYVLIAQLVLSGCAGEAVEETSSSSSSEINFDAYVGRDASTRSSITDIDFLKRDLNPTFNAGFGVFARYNHDGNTSSLLDTEHVYWKTGKEIIRIGDMNIPDFGQVTELWISMPLRLIVNTYKWAAYLLIWPGKITKLVHILI